MNRLASDEAAARRARVLLGFMTEDEAQTFLGNQAVEPVDQLLPLWQQARSAYEALPVHDDMPPRLEEIPSDAADLLTELEQGPGFQQHFANREYQFRLIEIDRLVAFQQFVDTEFAAVQTQAQLADGGLREKVAYCLPRNFTSNFAVGQEGGPGNFALTLSTLSRNAEVAGYEVQQVPDQPLKIAFLVTTRMNWVQVAEFEGRYFLKNGYHRVWALRQQGDAFVPAIVAKARSFEDIGAGPGFFPPAIILSDKPPLFRHFADDRLAPSMRVKSMLKIIRMTAQQFLVPRVP